MATWQLMFLFPCKERETQIYIFGQMEYVEKLNFKKKVKSHRCDNIYDTNGKLWINWNTNMQKQLTDQNIVRKKSQEW